MSSWKVLGTITFIGAAYLIASAVLTVIGFGLAIMFKILLTIVEIVCGILLLTVAIFFLSGGRVSKEDPGKEKK